MMLFETVTPDGAPLLLMEPNAVDKKSTGLSVPFSEIAAPGGARILDTTIARSSAHHEYEFIVENWEQRAALRAFFDARRGKYEAFWIPTWQWEFDVYGSNDSQLWVNRAGYVESMWPLGGPLTRFVILQGDAYSARSMIAATASVAPGVDRLDCDGGNAVNSDPPIPHLALGTVPDDSYRALWLRYGRFDTDDFVIDHRSTDGPAIITLPFIEIPADAPVAET